MTKCNWDDFECRYYTERGRSRAEYKCKTCGHGGFNYREAKAHGWRHARISEMKAEGFFQEVSE